MDTDFRMFSSDYHGSLPGIDSAQVLEGAAYHSLHDTVERIRKGTIQVSHEHRPPAGALTQISSCLNLSFFAGQKFHCPAALVRFRGEDLWGTCARRP